MNEEQLTADETLSAYIDGELDEQTADTLTARLAEDGSLMARLEQLRSADAATRRLMESMDDLPIPDAVLNTIDNSRAESNVVTFPSRDRSPFLQMPVALAASVALVAGFVGSELMRNFAPPGLTVETLSVGTVATESTLYQLLESAPSGASRNVSDEIDAGVLLSFQAEDGDYCRQLTLSSPSANSHAVACRRDNLWQIEALARSDRSSGQYQQASGTVPDSVNAAVSALLGDGEILPEDQEKLIISAGWKKTEN